MVPTTAVAPEANAGVTVTSVAPYGGLVADAARLAVGAATTVAVVAADFPGSSAEVATMLTVPVLAGAVQAPVPALMVPAPGLPRGTALHVTVPRNPPVTEAEKVLAAPAETVGLAGLTGATATVCGVMVTLASTALCRASVALTQ